MPDASRYAEQKKPFTSFCWGEHHASLTEKTHPKCQKCGWLICECGNCLCNMPLARGLIRRYRQRSHTEFIFGTSQM
jgi:hypothetical protein